MAELHHSPAQGKPGKRGAAAGGGRHKRDTRVDLTPMVDLGFLLITFFMLSTTMAQPRAVTLNMPYKEPDRAVPRSAVKEHTALTIIIGGRGQLYCYEGKGDDPGKPLLPIGFEGPGNIRDLIIRKKKAIAVMVQQGRLGPKDKLTILIKPGETAVYDDLIRVIDEMSINDVAVYAIMDLDATDRRLLAHR